jgi:hypothetical protein
MASLARAMMKHCRDIFYCRLSSQKEKPRTMCGAFLLLLVERSSAF